MEKGKLVNIYIVGNSHIFEYENIQFIELFNKADGFMYHDTDIVVPDLEDIDDIKF